jgi:lipid II:glycine glycyltransferase (peptidoglycan interpeptide bridge formation enzyme)
MLKLLSKIAAKNIYKLNVSEAKKEDWTFLTEIIDHTLITQSWPYGSAISRAKKINVERFNMGNDALGNVAFAQVLTKRLVLNFAIARINGGPIFLPTYSNNVFILYQTISAIKSYLKSKGIYLLSLAPNIRHSDIHYQTFKQLAYKLPIYPWGSSIIDLKKTEEEILGNFNGKWRNGLNKSMKSNITVFKINKIESILPEYIDYQKSKNFIGIDSNLLKEISHEPTSKNWEVNIIRAQKNDTYAEEILGSIVTIRNANTETYLMGMSTEHGKKLQANSLLLWHAILLAKQNGCINFDLGGLNNNTPQGIKKFKEGLNGNKYVNIGEWVCI